MNDKKKTNHECYIGIVQYLGFKYSKALCFTNLKSRMKENKEWQLIIWLKKYKYSDVATYCILSKKRMFSSQIQSEPFSVKADERKSEGVWEGFRLPRFFPRLPSPPFRPSLQIERLKQFNLTRLTWLKTDNIRIRSYSGTEACSVFNPTDRYYFTVR